MTTAYKAGRISVDDLNRSKLAYIQTEIKEAQAVGKNTLELQKEERAVQALIPKVSEADKMHKDLQHTILETDAAFNQFVSAMASGSESMAQAAKQLTEAMISQLEQYAEKKGVEALATGFDQLAVGDPKATLSFESSALWFALAAAGAAAGGAMSGSGGGSGSGRNSTNSASNPGGAQQTNSSGGSTSVTGVQKFAAGGLITGPTLAMLGEDSSSPTEAVLNLDDETSMGKIRDSLGGSGGPQIHVHVKGMISPDNLSKVVRQINQRVNNRQLTLQASNSLRTTRRSQ